MAILFCGVKICITTRAGEMQNKLVFVDTNVWVARTLESHIFYERARNILERLVEQNEPLAISGQVIREFISVCSTGRNLSRALAWEELQQQIEAMRAHSIFLSETEVTSLKLMDLGSRYVVIGKQIHDANIVATMLTHAATRLATFNPDDFKRFTEIEVVVP